ncbi:hypothetical protein K491DRAFT_67330 [Lophiostoma macrostomum CBS 122681]|uniref:Uncharacterized protein n=1 Tax=Lophiostoma macrostomum CBS 122681 TaxID=1314788 RepID=A0A6A6SX62_9PLEO|nr:hypothetical protein K491DRAFT_67330 [Lophiostoma macrostomum CBS 122681]
MSTTAITDEVRFSVSWLGQMRHLELEKSPEGDRDAMMEGVTTNDLSQCILPYLLMLCNELLDTSLCSTLHHSNSFSAAKTLRSSASPSRTHFHTSHILTASRVLVSTAMCFRPREYSYERDYPRDYPRHHSSVYSSDHSENYTRDSSPDYPRTRHPRSHSRSRRSSRQWCPKCDSNSDLHTTSYTTYLRPRPRKRKPCNMARFFCAVKWFACCLRCCSCFCRAVCICCACCHLR